LHGVHVLQRLTVTRGSHAQTLHAR